MCLRDYGYPDSNPRTLSHDKLVDKGISTLKSWKLGGVDERAHDALLVKINEEKGCR